MSCGLNSIKGLYRALLSALLGDTKGLGYIAHMQSTLLSRKMGRAVANLLTV